MFEQFIKFRKYFLLTSQLLGIIICVYFILNVQRYQISWNLFLWLMPIGIINSINSFLANVGTLILIVPLVVILLSVLIPENMTLRILGSFFGMSSTLIILFSGILRNSLTEVYNMKIFLVTKILTLEEKRLILKEELIKLINEKHQQSLELYTLLKEQLLENSMTIYDEKLSLFKESIEIKLYAKELVNGLLHVFMQNKHMQQTLLNTEYIKLIFQIILALGGFFLVATIATMLIDSTALIAGFTKVLEGFKLSLQNAESLANTQEITLKVTNILKEYIPKLLKDKGLNKLEDAIKEAFANVQGDITTLQSNVETLATIVHNMPSNE